MSRTADRPSKGGKKEVYSFALVLGGFSELNETIEDALFVAGCSDALLGLRDGQPFLRFDREAISFQHAIRTAIEDAENAGHGIRVLTVIPVGAEEIQQANKFLQSRGAN